MADLRDRSLLTIVEEVLGPSSCQYQTLKDPISRGTKALFNWYRVVYVLSKVSCHPSGSALWNSMSIWHRQSFRMIFDWWTASYQDSSYSLASILALIDRCNEVDLHRLRQEGSERDAETVVLGLLALKRWPKGDVMPAPRLPGSRAVLSGYHEQLHSLFLFEFDTINDLDGQNRKEGWARRRWARSRAARSAFCQQMAWQLLERDQTNEPGTEITDSALRSGTQSSGTDRASAKTFGIGFDRLFGAEREKQTDLEVKGPVIEACPWLPPVAGEDLPYFLWDLKNSRTVETSELQGSPQYTAISHTWGRWATGEAIRVKGITGWKVPQNSKFPVEDIPEILQKSPCKTRHVWLDLCCIPQEFGSAIGAREIARQAQIFRKAQTVVAWLNEVDDLEGLAELLRWKALQLLRFREGSKQKRRDELVEKLWHRAAGKRTGLLVPRSGQSTNEMQLNPWFTSLWTLQEVALRPDMWLSARDWSFLSFDGVNPLPLSGLISVHELFLHQETSEDASHLFEFENLSRVGLDEMETWRFKSGLCKLLNLDQVTLLTLGDHRQCTERRAEAIMSALGTTKWYEEILQQVSPESGIKMQQRLEEGLVLGKYPISFVREVCSTIPGDFFGSYLKFNPLGHENGYGVSEAHGSMLPFSISSVVFQSASAFRNEISREFAEPHGTVCTWEVMPSGHVHIRKACVVSSSVIGLGQSSTEQSQVIAAMTVPTMSAEEHKASLPLQTIRGGKFDYSDPSWFDLNLWIGHQATCTHAILTEFCPVSENESEDTLQCSGIIIQETPSGSLAKIAHFQFFDEQSFINTGEVKSVGWIVG